MPGADDRTKLGTMRVLLVEDEDAIAQPLAEADLELRHDQVDMGRFVE